MMVPPGKKEEFATMLNKKKTLLLTLLGLASVATLAGCDDVVAKPTDDVYNQALIAESDDIPNNTMKAIYDAVVTSGDSSSEKVLNNILLIYSKSFFGPFFDDGETKGLKTVYESGTDEEKAAFAAKFGAYKDADGNAVPAKLEMFYNEFMYRVLKVFHGYVTNSSYQVRNEFIEKKFVDAQRKSYYTIGDDYFEDGVLVDGSIRITSDPSVISGEGKFFKDIFGNYGEYIEKAVLPDIYRTLLISQYLYKENYRTLGNTFARKVRYIKLTDNAAYSGATENLVKAYAKLVIEAGLDADVYGLTFLDDLYKGVALKKVADGKLYGESADADNTLIGNIYKEANWVASEGKGTFEVEGKEFSAPDQSTLGSYYTSFNRLLSSTDRYLESDVTDIRSDFTGSGAYNIMTGLTIKTNSLYSTSAVTDGWYANSSGLDSLPMKDRLFKMGVANEVDTRPDENHEGTYGWYRNGHYYLVPEVYQKDIDTTPYVMHNGSDWYIVRVDEAVKGPKLALASASKYSEMDAHKDSPYDYTEYIARQVALTMASQDTYKTSSNKYFIDKMAVTFHDTYVYNYFVKTFPDLF